jgi:hypothetical protein
MKLQHHDSTEYGTYVLERFWKEILAKEACFYIEAVFRQR